MNNKNNINLFITIYNNNNEKYCILKLNLKCYIYL